MRKFENNLYAIAENGNGFRTIYSSSDGGRHWLKRDFSSLGSAFATATASGITLTENGALIASVAKSIYSQYSNLCMSLDHGVTWTFFGDNFPGGVMYTFDLIGNYIYASGGTGLWRIEAPEEGNVVRLLAGNTHGAQGETVMVPVSVKNFKEILGIQFSVSWDTSIVALSGVSDFSLSGLDESNFNLSQKDQGHITFSWSEPSLHSQTIADNSSLFNLTFVLRGNFGDATLVRITNDPMLIEVIDTSYNVLPVRMSPGIIAIDTAIVVSGKIVCQ